jgi:predicted NAD-dependent protein-ADP-ribosyltransferase YbiA (DUF1768 family)
MSQIIMPFVKYLHSQKVEELCSPSPTRTIDPIFFHTTVNTNGCFSNFREFINQLSEWELTIGYFQ